MAAPTVGTGLWRYIKLKVTLNCVQPITLLTLNEYWMINYLYNIDTAASLPVGNSLPRKLADSQKVLNSGYNKIHSDNDNIFSQV